MRKIEIKEIGIKSAFKATVYFLIIPAAIMLVIGFLVTVIGALAGNGTMALIGLPYIFMSIFMIGIYGALSMLTSLVYNKLTQKFGGLELVIQDSQEQRIDQLGYWEEQR